MGQKIKYNPMPCPECGSTNIGVKDNIIITNWKKEARLTWGYCRDCGKIGPQVICAIDATDADEINTAYKAWNKEKVAV